MTLSILVLLMAQITFHTVGSGSNQTFGQQNSLVGVGPNGCYLEDEGYPRLLCPGDPLPAVTRHPRIELPEPRPVEYHPCGGGWVNGSCRDGGGSPEPFAFGSSADMDDFCAVKNTAGEWIPVSCRKLAHAILNSERTHP